MHRYRRTALMLTMLLIPCSGLAQQSSSASSESLFTIQDREFRLRGFAESIKKGVATDMTFNAQRAAFYDQRAALRADCRDQLRRSNKTSMLRILVECYEDELTLLKSYLDNQTETVQGTAGLLPVTRTHTLSRIDALTDAIGTILFAIDSGVYDSKEKLLEAKQNLTAKYMQPLWDAWLTVRVDRTLTWIAHLIAKIDALQAQESAKGLTRAALPDARECLTAQETALQPLLKPETSDRGRRLPGILTALQECMKKIQAIPRALTESGTLLPSL